MWLSHIWLGLGWMAYGALHSILASAFCKDLMKRKLKKYYPYYRLFYIMFASITLLIMLYWLWVTPSFRIWNPEVLPTVAGILITLTGIIIMGICLKKYLRSMQFINNPDSKEINPVLFQKGLHSRVRHPLYFGTFLFLWGSFLLIPFVSIFVTNFIITAYTLMGIRFEEKKLINMFGESYTRYMQQVPMIWPRF
jgi:methanethiol S-methyltransferase